MMMYWTIDRICKPFVSALVLVILVTSNENNVASSDTFKISAFSIANLPNSGILNLFERI
jgi:hypothetical protein